jgi:tetratricopeptide (TPR) repeat protein
MRKLALAALLALGATGPLKADARLEAFAKSYTLEGQQDYEGALNAVMAVYRSGSYISELRLGWLNLQLKRYTESLQHYRAAKTLLPKAVDAALGVGAAAVALGNVDEAKSVYEGVLAQDPHQSVAHYRLGLIAYYRDDFSGAQAHFRRVLESYPLDYDATVALGWAKLKAGQKQEAERCFRNAQIIKPGDDGAAQGLKALGTES